MNYNVDDITHVSQEEEFLMSNMSAFADCGSTSLVLRLPYKYAVLLLKSCPEGKFKERLTELMKRAATRSKKFTQMLEELE